MNPAATNLDTLFLTKEAEIFEFCKKLLFKRLSSSCKEIEVLEKEDGTVDGIFVDEIFDNLYNFKCFIAASHGTPRDMIYFFAICASKFKRDFSSNCIDYLLVSEVARDLYNMQKRRLIDRNPRRINC